MTNPIRIIYLYIVAFITLGMIVGGINSTVYNFASYIYPTSDIFFEEETYNYSYHQEMITDNSTSIQKNNYKKEKLKDGIVSLVVIALGGVLYKYHWNLIEKINKREE